MSIKFPDYQVLVSRTDQIPKPMREGDSTIAGKLSPQIASELELKQKKVNDSSSSDKLQNKKQGSESKFKRKPKKRPSKDGHLDIRI